MLTVIDKQALSVKDNIDRLKALEGEMLKHEQVDVEVVHHFAPGMYAREMHLKADVMLTGKIHKHAHLNILSSGRALLVNEDGRQIVEAPFSFVSKAGTKRAFYAYTDVVWTTIHATNLTDLDEIEREMIAESPEQLDQADHAEFLREYGISDALAEQIAANPERGLVVDGISVRPSPIHGMGVYADKQYKSGERIALAAVNGLNTEVGRNTNHSVSPNCEMRADGKEIWIWALQDVSGAELTVDYRAVLDMRRGQTP